MPDHPRIEWPGTYLGRLQAVTNELRNIGAPASADTLVQRFQGVTTDEVEAILAALILFGRAEKKCGLFQVLGEGEE